MITIEPVAVVPLGGSENTIVPIDEYSEPPAVIVIEDTAPAVRTAVAVAPEPPPPEIVIVGGDEPYPEPPPAIVIEDTTPVKAVILEDPQADPCLILTFLPISFEENKVVEAVRVILPVVAEGAIVVAVVFSSK